ncbi:40S ribosomal protein S19-3 [Forsythia ovata]|uniref:40S ribosomal protein S19-3 n=1 Tax=Forsythia ovata TaxID=205694 RepID=A0ABD1UU91_9LAMI
MELPEWTDIVKTGVLKELAPYDPDWYYVRAASMARKIYLRGGLGVGAFRRIYGGSKRNGSRPPHFCKSSGSVARHILQQLQEMSIIEMDPRGGRTITSSGRRDLDQVAGRIANFEVATGTFSHLHKPHSPQLSSIQKVLLLRRSCGGDSSVAYGE